MYTPICTKGIFAKGRGYTRYNRRTKTDGTKATLDCASGHKLVVPKDGSDIRECKCSGVACKWVTDASNDELPTCFPVCKAGCTKVAGSCMGSGRRLFDQAQEVYATHTFGIEWMFAILLYYAHTAILHPLTESSHTHTTIA